jgi:nitrogen fixation protein NifU and related proteins
MSSLYTATLLEHYRHPRNFGSLVNPDAAHEVLNPVCGDRIRLELHIEDDSIADVRFRGDACAICTAASSLLTEMLRSLPLAEAAKIQPESLLEALHAPIPETRLQCALLPLDALAGCLA